MNEKIMIENITDNENYASVTIYGIHVVGLED